MEYSKSLCVPVKSMVNYRLIHNSQDHLGLYRHSPESDGSSIHLLVWQCWCNKPLLAICLSSFYLKRCLQLCMMNKSQELIYSMVTIVNNLIIVTHFAKHCFYYKKFIFHRFLNYTSRPQQCPRIFLESPGELCTTSKISHQGRPFQSVVFSKETGLSMGEYALNENLSWSLIWSFWCWSTFQVVLMYTLLRFHLLFPQISGNLTVPWITGCSRKRAVSNLSFKAANGFSPALLVGMPLRKL